MAAPASRRTADIEPFEVMDVLSRAPALEAAGRRVVHMEIGEPDFTAPAPVVEAGVRALRNGLTAYTATLGLPSLREAIARHYGNKFSASVEPGRIAITAGASGGLLTVAALYVDAGDEVLVPDPGYPGYRHFVRAFEGVARPLPVSARTNFQPSLDMVREAWGPRTKGLVLGSPSNPTGTLIAEQTLQAIAGFIAERSGVLIVDEIYQGLVYGEAPWTALGYGVERMAVVVVQSLNGIRSIITGAIGAENLQGPLGIAQISGETAAQGLLSFVALRLPTGRQNVMSCSVTAC